MQPFQFNNESILHRVENAVGVQDDQVNENLLFTGNGVCLFADRPALALADVLAYD